MKTILISLIVLIGSVSMAQVSEKVVKGAEAQELIRALQIISEDGNNDQAGVDYSTGASQEGMSMSEDVTAHWLEISGKIGSKSVECSSQVYMTYKGLFSVDGGTLRVMNG